MRRNHLQDQTSPYLLQHADNPVDWYPWCEEAFRKAEAEDKPVFLSIGYSTCHWCHVMAHESFEDAEIADILNRYFVAIKVDKEERPDIDSIYMSVCQALTGSGGWPTSIFMTAEQKPFFAGTYFPKNTRFGHIGFKELLLAIKEKWQTDRKTLEQSAKEITALFYARDEESDGDINDTLIEHAVEIYEKTFDSEFGGFGNAPKFPSPHNLVFLLEYYEKSGNMEALHMAEKTLLQMCRGGIFDHIAGGFSRYSTDRFFLAPHFEKMLYDNALLIMAYCKAYQVTKKRVYRETAEKTAAYILNEMTSPEGGFYSAQDADIEGTEGKYYLFEPDEIVKILGKEEGAKFNRYFDITVEGNFEGKNIPNRLKPGPDEYEQTPSDEQINDVYVYRKGRYKLHTDDKILTSWNSLMIAAMCSLYRVTGNENYLRAAENAQRFIELNLSADTDNGVSQLYISYRNGKRSGKGLLDDYANQVFALLALYEAALNNDYLEHAKLLCAKAVEVFYDRGSGGFFLNSCDSEKLIFRPKETYDGAVFSGNSAMAYNLTRISMITGEKKFADMAENQLRFMSAEAEHYPAGYAMFLTALMQYIESPVRATVVVNNKQELKNLSCGMPLNAVIEVMESPTAEYPLKNGKPTFYICRGRSCHPPVNSFEEENCER